jgi:hypothetical protein
MIAYEELCDALTRWRTKQGLPSTSPKSSSAARTSAAMPVAPAPVAPRSNPPAAAAAMDEDRTSTTVAAAPKRADEPTGEIDIDSVEVMDEN